MPPVASGAEPGENRARLLELSATLFASQGYAQVSLRQLAAELGVSTGAIYSNFRNKAALLAEVLGARVLEDMERSQRSRPGQWLPDVVRESFLRMPERAEMRSLLLEAGAAARTDTELRERVRPTLKALIDQWIEDYRAWQTFAHVDPEIDMGAVVTVLWASELGIGVLEAQDAVRAEPEWLAEVIGGYLESLAGGGDQAPTFDPLPAPTAARATDPTDSTKLGLADESATRERLIDAAIELFAERGYATSTVRDLARSTGVTTGSIYGNFDSKATLLVAAIEARLDRDLEDLPAASGEPVSPGGLIMFHVNRFDLRARLRALLIEGAAAARSEPDVHERLRAVSLRHEERWVAECTSRLATPTASSAQEVGRFVTLVWCTELGLGLLEAFDLPVPDSRTIGTLLLQLFQRSGSELFAASAAPTASGEQARP